MPQRIVSCLLPLPLGWVPAKAGEPRPGRLCLKPRLCKSRASIDTHGPTGRHCTSQHRGSRRCGQKSIKIALSSPMLLPRLAAQPTLDASLKPSRSTARRVLTETDSTRRRAYPKQWAMALRGTTEPSLREWSHDARGSKNGHDAGPRLGVADLDAMRECRRRILLLQPK